jgi:hypothetical protein
VRSPLPLSSSELLAIKAPPPAPATMKFATLSRKGVPLAVGGLSAQMIVTLQVYTSLKEKQCNAWMRA